MVENLNYSSQALATWPSRYNQDLANRHHRRPELIANHVYGDRMGNSKSGDGWKYRGRGLIQLTGYNNYRAYQTASGDPVTIRPDLLESPDVAVKAACWYWQENNLNKWADVGDIVRCSSVINTGKSSSSEKFINGLDDRKALYRKALSVLSWGLIWVSLKRKLVAALFVVSIVLSLTASTLVYRGVFTLRLGKV